MPKIAVADRVGVHHRRGQDALELVGDEADQVDVALVRGRQLLVGDPQALLPVLEAQGHGVEGLGHAVDVLDRGVRVDPIAPVAGGQALAGVDHLGQRPGDRPGQDERQEHRNDRHAADRQQEELEDFAGPDR